MKKIKKEVGCDVEGEMGSEVGGEMGGMEGEVRRKVGRCEDVKTRILFKTSI